MNQAFYGILAIIVACIIWGFAPIYNKLLSHVPPFELLAHRTIWSFLFFFAVLIYNRKEVKLWNAILVSRQNRTVVIISSILIATNWFFFIFAIQTNNATEASLGYFIMPLVTVVWGLIIFKEKLSYAQWFAVLLACLLYTSPSPRDATLSRMPSSA